LDSYYFYDEKYVNILKYVKCCLENKIEHAPNLINILMPVHHTLSFQEPDFPLENPVKIESKSEINTYK